MSTNAYKYNKCLPLKSPMDILVPFYIFMAFRTNIISTIAVNGVSIPAYVPQDNIAIDCGSSGNNTAPDGRIWEGDLNSKFFPSQYQNNASVTYVTDPPPPQVSSVPYQTARVSHSEFNYVVPVTAPGQKVVRLHFFATPSYGDFNSSKAFFSVKAAQYTLLSNFSPVLAAYALDVDGVVKEFCLHLEEGKSVLNITFTPVSSISESFAFINGIEVVSIPANLYYSVGSQELRPKFVGQPDINYPIGNDTAMEMLYRINIGGADILPANDTGMFRSWGLEDDYLTVPGYSVLPVDPSDNLNFSVIPRYTAPSSVYQTARSMGNKDRALIKSYKLTWEFPVDTKFYYLVRLHFCEIESVVNTGERVFLIFLANQTAEKSADVMGWSNGERYTPVYRDYVVAMFGNNGGDQKRVNLSLALQANPDDWRTVYADAILNGVEIFKLNDTTGSLAGLNPDLVGTTPPPPVHQQATSQTITTAVVSGVTSGVALLSMVGLFICLPRRNLNNVHP